MGFFDGNMGNILEIISGSDELLDVIRPLREGLFRHHAKLTEHFASDFSLEKIDETENGLLACSRRGGLHIAVAQTKDGAHHVGFCITRILADKTGDIFSMFVDEAYRGLGIGQKLMMDALRYLNQKGVDTINTHVLYGNEKVLSFYQKFGLYPRTIVLRRYNADKLDGSATCR